MGGPEETAAKVAAATTAQNRRRKRRSRGMGKGQPYLATRRRHPHPDPGKQPGVAGTLRARAGSATSRTFLRAAGDPRIERQRLGAYRRRQQQRTDGATTDGD